MKEDNQEFVLQKFEELTNDNSLTFESMENPMYPCPQFSAIAFLYSKLKNPAMHHFLVAVHDYIYINDFDLFKDFSEEDVKECICYGISINENEDGFMIRA
jgi:hypothetical protein